jgi:hypothetical protein
MGDKNPWSNAGVRYQGSHDDAAPAYDSDLTGKIDIPVLPVHAIGDRAPVPDRPARRSPLTSTLVELPRS